MENINKETITKTLRIEKSLCEKIQQMADENQRDFTKQVRFMLVEYLKIKENK